MLEKINKLVTLTLAGPHTGTVFWPIFFSLCQFFCVPTSHYSCVSVKRLNKLLFSDKGRQTGWRDVGQMQREHIRGMTSEPVSSSCRCKIGLKLAFCFFFFLLLFCAEKAVSGSIVGESVVVL